MVHILFVFQEPKNQAFHSSNPVGGGGSADNQQHGGKPKAAEPLGSQFKEAEPLGSQFKEAEPLSSQFKEAEPQHSQTQSTKKNSLKWQARHEKFRSTHGIEANDLEETNLTTFRQRGERKRG